MFSILNRPNFRILAYSAIAIVIIVGSLLYSNYLAIRLAALEEKRIETFAKAQQLSGDLDADEEDYLTFVFDQIKGHQLIPTILADSAGNITDFRNLGIPEDLPDSLRNAQAQPYLDKLKKRGDPPPLIIKTYSGSQYIYYDQSDILKQLNIYPYIQLVVIFVFISIIFIGFYVATRSEQNKVWVGLAKETAHQLGTPVSSLLAWVEYLKVKLDDTADNREIADELSKDVERLKVITERFSKIGSKPELKDLPVKSLLDNVSNYVRKRMSKRVSLELDNRIPESSLLPVNPPLFEWVIENLLKNALDAIPNDGVIRIHAEETAKDYIIDVEDNGKGIPKHLFRQVFKPGFTTKKRGWGLGLSLTKRIVENYHDGKIFVKHSELGKGTTFRVVLHKSKGRNKK